MKRRLKEYLVTVYSADNVRLGAFTLYGKSYAVVLEKANTRLNTGEVLTLTYKGQSLFAYPESWEDEY